jgi:5-methyltetrahydropteroyltriglutamate--homocysteine methyltransferase
MLFPTTLVGSYPQPEWLIDRQRLASRFPPRVRALELWRVPAPYLAEEAKPQGILFEAANPRHAHEWVVFRDLKMPDDKILIPGVLATTTNYVEHPLLVSERLEKYAGIVGRDRVIVGTDCGFGTFAGFGPVEPDIVYLKLGSLVEGARIASERLWRTPS